MAVAFVGKKGSGGGCTSFRDSHVSFHVESCGGNWAWEWGDYTGPLSSSVLRSAAWSGWSFMGRESRVARKDLAKESSVILKGSMRMRRAEVWRGFCKRDRGGVLEQVSKLAESDVCWTGDRSLAEVRRFWARSEILEDATASS